MGEHELGLGTREQRDERAPTGSAVRFVLVAVFFLTGFSALVLQVVWQRVMSLHAGVDLVSFTTVVSAFLAGLGVGSLVGGYLADRLGPRRSVLAFAASNLAIGAFAWFSLWVFYDLYRAQAEELSSTPAKFIFNFVILLVPTTLMGLSTPLAARSIVVRADQAGSRVGRLYAINTIGAALGAAAAGWLLLGSLGFASTVRVAGSLNIVAAIALWLISRTRAEPTDPSPAEPLAAASGARPAIAPIFGGRVWPWYLVYGLTGAVALGLEVVFFRVIDTAMRSNSYSFPHVLSLYLALFGIGAAVASPVVKRAKRPDTWFLALQFVVGLSALIGLLLLVKGIPHSPFAEAAKGHLSGEGLAVGFSKVDGAARSDLALVFVGFPLLIMGLPVLAMGASFPFVEALVSDRLETLGRHTGRLLFANIAGNVLGTLLVGFWMLDRLGTSRTYRVLGVALLVPGLVAAWSMTSVRRRVVFGLGAIVVMGAALVAVPSNQALYASLHGVQADQLAMVEDRTCTAALRHVNAEHELTVNGSPQNSYPFDDFHVLIGATPALVHPEPSEAMALGLGIGATPYGLGLDPRVDQISTVEICGGEVGLLGSLRDEGKPELRRLLDNPRQQIHVGDGRDFLLRSGKQFDIVVVDTLRPQSAFSGSLYSVQFYELIRDRLAPGGLVAQWQPTTRVTNSLTQAFPYVLELRVWSYFGSRFVLASNAPIDFDRDAIIERLHAATSSDLSSAEREQFARLEEFFRTTEVRCVANGAPHPPPDESSQNHDLHPRDEYFLNNSSADTATASCR